MSPEFHKTKNLQESLSAWQEQNVSARKSLITELGEMAVESAQSDGAFAEACNAAGNLLFAIEKFPELSSLVEKTLEQSE